MDKSRTKKRKKKVTTLVEEIHTFLNLNENSVGFFSKSVVSEIIDTFSLILSTELYMFISVLLILIMFFSTAVEKLKLNFFNLFFYTNSYLAKFKLHTVINVDIVVYALLWVTLAYIQECKFALFLHQQIIIFYTDLLLVWKT